MQQILQAQSEQIAALTASQQEADAAKPAPKVDKGGVWVSQWRTTMFNNKAQKVDEQRQYYNADDFKRLSDVHPQDAMQKRSGFEVLGISYEIVEDLRK